jgi:hypothetical protein
MGCDYYILKILHIYYNDNEYLEVELDRIRCYYEDIYDEDEEDYDEKMNEYIKNILMPRMKPIIIFNNHENQWNKLDFETKYKTLVENEMKKHGKAWNEIVKIIKVEVRY